VKLKAIRWALNLLPLRIMKLGRASYAQCLHALMLQATTTLDGAAARTNEIGTFPTKLKPMGCSKEIGLLSCRFALGSGAISAFSLPKLLRYVARMGIPDLHDVDIKGSHVNAMWDIATELGVQSTRLQALREDRDAWIRTHLAAMPFSNEDYDSHKEPILAVLNGMARRPYWPAALVELSGE
jgi:hypothetical protein